jgi:hypothetical protein
VASRAQISTPKTPCSVSTAVISSSSSNCQRQRQPSLPPPRRRHLLRSVFMDHQRPPPPFSRSSLFNTAPQPTRQYGSEQQQQQQQQQQSRQDGRTHPAYNALHHPETESSRTTSSFGYGTPSFASDMRPRSRPLSPMRFGAMRSAASSPEKQNGAAAKESPSALYHEGRTFFFLFYI